jgi:hypothetical protein
MTQIQTLSNEAKEYTPKNEVLSYFLSKGIFETGRERIREKSFVSSYLFITRVFGLCG